MKKRYLTAAALLLTAAALAQRPAPAPQAAAPAAYQETAPKINALVHTKLDLQFDYKKRYAYGKAWLTLKPYAYPTDSLRLDAKGMDIKTVALVNGSNQQPLKYSYADGQNLRINLGKTVAPGTDYTVYIEYTAKPDELKTKGSAAITDAKGLYFINPDSAVAGKPVQIWTQGETEASSVWFPTIDRPNQKTTSEISLTVPSKYVTLSNGALVSQKPAGAGLRTDTWKMEQPHAPYLFMLAIGDFKITKDKWQGKDVDYYLEPAYAPYAKQIFGDTPEMLEFFSQKLGVAYPWNKYAQIVVRDYVSGAMENTTATLHGDFVQQTPRQMLDRDYAGGLSVIAHELFHQWFGDYVTAESWSNLTVNESFADFSEGLWAEHKYGQDAADAHNYRYLRRYLGSPRDAVKPLVRFYYDDKEEMFDLVSYQKGGAVLQLLRTHLGDPVFFAGLKQYLTQNALGTGEAHQLRLALEAASGQDLNWFFNQWYFAPGHPIVTIDYAWDAARKVQSVTVKQTQPGEPFTLPLAIDLYVGGKTQRRNVVLRQPTETLEFPVAAQPDLVNVDATKTMVWQKTDNKPLAAYAYQYKNAPRLVDRHEAIVAAQAKPTEAAARGVLLAGLNDKFYGLRMLAIQSLNLENAALRKAATPVLRKLAASDKETVVRAEALLALGKIKEKRDEKLFAQQLKSESYAVKGAALRALAEVSPAKALAQAKAFEADKGSGLTPAITEVYAAHGGAAQWPYIRDRFDAGSPRTKAMLLEGMLAMMTRLDDPTAFSENLDRIKAVAIQFKSQGADKAIIPLLQAVKDKKTGPNAAQAQQALDKAVQEIEQAK
ncbi:Peptidase M1 membrane alanine aminopeptidase [Hymenobacter roseosalivarius DSM 11622]|uniref:Aminopeptidase N n=1 Tax=Hymenobacter roseosalivarius DSM 11622 TaxID=645990 RepID=A0A1W1VM95_9BACT|nr:M1 family aminopeptidase [Hymenobacter roseosalivarius]SMB94074.1 Peptidase M1 membrane alanine aminopeptidase [Hymenobacter roseosalivarius DSM 11622]